MIVDGSTKIVVDVTGDVANDVEVRDAPRMTSSSSGGTGGASMIGAVFGGRWKIEAPLSSGGMGAVFIASHTDTGRRVALKVIRDDGAGNAELAARFRKETALLAAISHPNVVTFLDSGVDAERGPEKGNFFLVMELLGGRPLRSVMGQPLPWRRAFRIAADVCRALSAVHKGGIVHRDLKPENIFLQEAEGHDEIAKLIDFGIARLHDSTTMQTMTKTGAVVGTPGYIAPEQLQGQPASPASDVYAVGVILYELVTGTFPFEAPTPHAMLVKQLMEPLKPPRAALSTVPGHVESVILRLMDRAPASRIPTAKDALATLVECLKANDSLPPTAATETENDLQAEAARLLASSSSAMAAAAATATAAATALPTEGAGIEPPGSGARPAAAPTPAPDSGSGPAAAPTPAPDSGSGPAAAPTPAPPGSGGGLAAAPTPAPPGAGSGSATSSKATPSAYVGAGVNVSAAARSTTTARTGTVIPPVPGMQPQQWQKRRARSTGEKIVLLAGIGTLLCLGTCVTCIAAVASSKNEEPRQGGRGGEDGDDGDDADSARGRGVHINIAPGDGGPENSVDVHLGKNGVHVSPGRVKVGDKVDISPGKVQVNIPGMPTIDLNADDRAGLQRAIDQAVAETQAAHSVAHAGRRPTSTEVKKLVQAHAKELRSCGPTKITTTVSIVLSPEGVFDIDDDVDPSTMPPQTLAALLCAAEHVQSWQGPLFQGDDVVVSMPVVLGGSLKH